MEELPDSRLVELAQTGDEQAFAELASRYFGPVYDFAARLTRDRDDADAITAATFEDAMYDLGGLRDGTNFRGWLFSTARNASLACLGHEPCPRPLAFERTLPGEPAFDTVDPALLADRAVRSEAVALAPLVWEAAAALDPRQLSLLDLQLRKGLDGQDLAVVAGVGLANCDIMLARLYSATNDAMGAFIMANHGRPACDELRICLSGLLVTPSAMPPEVRKLVDHHVAECDVCGEQKSRRLAPFTVFSALAPVLPPAGTEERVLAGLLARWPGGTGPFLPVIGGPPLRGDPPGIAGSLAGPPSTVAGALPAAGGGFGRAFGAAQRRPHVLRAFAGLGAAAVLLVALLVVPSSPIALTQFHGGLATPGTNETSDAGGHANGPTNGPTVFVVIPVTATPTATGTPSPARATPSSISGTSSAQVGAEFPTPVPPSATPTLPPSATPTSTIPPTTVPPTATPTSVATPRPPTPTPVATPCTAVLTPNISTVNASTGSSSFEILNGSACVSGAYAVNVGAASQSWLKVSPGAGALAPISSDTITVTADLAAIPNGAAGLITVIWPGGQFTVSVTVSTTG